MGAPRYNLHRCYTLLRRTEVSSLEVCGRGESTKSSHLSLLPQRASSPPSHRTSPSTPTLLPARPLSSTASTHPTPAPARHEPTVRLLKLETKAEPRRRDRSDRHEDRYHSSQDLEARCRAHQVPRPNEEDEGRSWQGEPSLPSPRAVDCQLIRGE